MHGPFHGLVLDGKREQLEKYHFFIDRKLSLYGELLVRQQANILSAIKYFAHPADGHINAEYSTELFIGCAQRTEHADSNAIQSLSAKKRFAKPSSTSITVCGCMRI